MGNIWEVYFEMCSLSFLDLFVPLLIIITIVSVVSSLGTAIHRRYKLCTIPISSSEMQRKQLRLIPHPIPRFYSSYFYYSPYAYLSHSILETQVF